MGIIATMYVSVEDALLVCLSVRGTPMPKHEESVSHETIMQYDD